MSDLAHPVIRSDKAASLPVIFLGILGAIKAIEARSKA